MNQLTILGGSAAGIGTDQGCSGYLLDIDGTTIVLDLGPSTLIELRKHTDYRELDAIVISHLHMDHVLDLFILRFMLNYNPVKANRKIPLYLPPDGIAFMAKAADLWATDPDEVDDYFTGVFEMQEYDPAQPLTVGSATITFAETAHVIPCWAMRIQPGDGEDLVYTADTGIGVDLDEFASGASVIIADSASALDDQPAVIEGVHFNAPRAAEFASRAGCDHLILTHQWEERDPLRNLEVARKHFQGRISIAIPGLTATW